MRNPGTGDVRALDDLSQAKHGDITVVQSRSVTALMPDGKQLEAFVSFVEQTLGRHDFDVGTNRQRSMMAAFRSWSLMLKPWIRMKIGKLRSLTERRDGPGEGPLQVVG